jgi:hypothetical protein
MTTAKIIQYLQRTYVHKLKNCSEKKIDIFIYKKIYWVKLFKKWLKTIKFHWIAKSSSKPMIKIKIKSIYIYRKIYFYNKYFMQPFLNVS